MHETARRRRHDDKHHWDQDKKFECKNNSTESAVGLSDNSDHTSPKWTSLECFIAGIVVVCLAVALVCAFQLRGAIYIVVEQIISPNTGDISVFKFFPASVVSVPKDETINPAYYKTFATDSGKPVLLKNSLLHQWKAFSKWTPAFLEQTLPVVQVYEQNATSEFITFHDGKPLEAFLTKEKWSDFNAQHNHSSKDVLSRTRPPWLYFSADLLHLREDYPYGIGITNDVDPLYPLVVNDSGLQANLWLGTKGIETYMHLDASFNFFAQLHGRKRFTLVPPQIPMYPWSCTVDHNGLHPHIHHAQVPWKEHHNASAFRDNYSNFLTSSPTAVVVDVDRGDVLYVPPYWWHHVETLESPSVAINVWTDAPAYLRIHEVYEYPVPLNAHDPVSKRIDDAVRFLALLVERVELCPPRENSPQHSDALLRDWCSDQPAIFHDSARGFFGYLYEQRWQRLLEDGHINSAVPHPHENGVEVEPNVVAEHCQNKGSVRMNADQSLDADFLRRVDSIVPLFHDIQPAGVRRLCLGNYIEHVLAAAVGAASVGSCLKYCF